MFEFDFDEILTDSDNGFDEILSICFNTYYDISNIEMAQNIAISLISSITGIYSYIVDTYNIIDPIEWIASSILINSTY